jgi:regulator of sirC expression with transglutaminase-like and TPR domain
MIMSSRMTPRERFAAISRLPERQIDLGEAALLIAAEEQPGLDPYPWLDRLDDLGERLRPRLRRVRNDFDRLAALLDLLFGEEGLRGNAEDYYDPRNSYLNEVLDRRLGIPITLALVCLEVGKRAGVPLEGVGFPGHFLLRLGNHPHVLIDPFDGGRLLTQRDCEELLARLTNGEMKFDPRLLRTSGPKQILHRILNNLRGVYLTRSDVGRLVPVLDRMLLLDPEDPTALRERGVLQIRCGDPHLGIRDLETYLGTDAGGDDHEEILGLIVEGRRLTLVN